MDLPMTTLEVCIDSAAGLQACLDGGADRIELCSGLALGGLTPGAGQMHHAAAYPIPVYAMIRPRAGDFCFSSHEIDIMCTDIATAKEAGLAGVVLGAANRKGDLDYHTLERLCLAAGSLKKTLHRVIDTLASPVSAVEQAIDLGMDHILSSGGAPSVQDGIPVLAKMQQISAGRINILAGAGLTPETAQQIAQVTGVDSFHSSCRQPQIETGELTAFGFGTSQCYTTSVDVIREYKKVLVSADQ